MNTALQLKQKKFFGDMLVYKSADNAKFFSALSLPSFMRDWLVMRFSDDEGKIDIDEVKEYVTKNIPNAAQWKNYMFDLSLKRQTVRFLAKIQIDFDAAKSRALFNLPDFYICLRRPNLGGLSKLSAVTIQKAIKIFFGLQTLCRFALTRLI